MVVVWYLFISSDVFSGTRLAIADLMRLVVVPRVSEGSSVIDVVSGGWLVHDG